MPDLIDDLAKASFDAGAIDLFLCEDQPPRMRLQGEVAPAEGEPLDQKTLADFWKRCGADPVTDLETDVSYVIPGGRRLRVNLYRSLGLLSAVMRPIEEDIPGFAQLGVPAELFDPAYMGQLFETGYRAARDGNAWVQVPPELERVKQRSRRP